MEKLSMVLCAMFLVFGVVGSANAASIDVDFDGKVDKDQITTDLIVLKEALPSLSPGDVIHSIPAPGTNAEGLTWDGEFLWNSDIDDDMIYKLNPSDGAVIASIPSPSGLVEGLAWDGEFLWASGSQSDTIYQLDPLNGAVIHSFTSPGPDPWPHGITWDGQYLWVNDFNAKLLYKVDPNTGEVQSSIPAPGLECIGLAWDGKYLWSGDFQVDSLYQIDSSDGTIIQTIPSPDTNPRDLAWDGRYLWVASWIARTIYQVDTGVPVGPCEEDDSGALDIAGMYGAPGSPATMTVRIQNGPNSIASLGFEVAYNTTILDYAGTYTRGDCVADFDFFDVFEPEPGILRVGGFEAGADVIPEVASCVVVDLQFNALDCEHGKAYSLAELQELKDDISGWSTSLGCFQCGCSCDVNGDGQITPQDALCAFQKYLGICPTACGPCEEICCDVTMDGDCTPADALEIFKEYLGMPSVCSAEQLE